MKKKVTLTLDENVLDRAKDYVSKRNISLPMMIENYLDALTSEQKDAFELSPFVKSISSKLNLPEDIEKSWRETSY
jgi:hypothetical protein